MNEVLIRVEKTILSEAVFPNIYYDERCSYYTLFLFNLQQENLAKKTVLAKYFELKFNLVGMLKQYVEKVWIKYCLK